MLPEKKKNIKNILDFTKKYIASQLYLEIDTLLGYRNLNTYGGYGYSVCGFKSYDQKLDKNGVFNEFLIFDMNALNLPNPIYDDNTYKFLSINNLNKNYFAQDDDINNGEIFLKCFYWEYA